MAKPAVLRALEEKKVSSGRPAAVRCAIYGRTSSDEALDQQFNSLDAQREACAAYIESQRQLAWRLVPAKYDDGGFSGGSLDRPALTRLLEDVASKRVDMIVVYKIDRLTRSLIDFGKLVDVFDQASCSFVSVTQSFNTSSSMGRLTLNVLLSFAQFERELTSDRIRDKIKVSKQKGMWMGAIPPLGYAAADKRLVVNQAEAETVRQLFELCRQHQSILKTVKEARRLRLRSRPAAPGMEGPIFRDSGISYLLRNPIYIGSIRHKEAIYPGQHQPIIADDLWADVQAVIKRGRSAANNRVRNGQPRAKLLGRLHDDNDRPLVSMFGGSKPDRRRYYVSKPRPKDSPHAQSGDWRLLADRLESTVADSLRTHLIRSSRTSTIANLTHPADARVAIERKIAQITKADREADLHKLVETIRVSPGLLTINLSATKIEELLELGTRDIDPAFLLINAAFQKRRRGHEEKIVIGDNPLAIDRALLKHVAKGAIWWRSIQRGMKISEIAKDEGVSAKFIGLHLPAAFLAPDILSLIVEGRQPASLTVSALREVEIPSDWSEQRALFGIAESKAHKDRGSSALGISGYRFLGDDR